MPSTIVSYINADLGPDPNYTWINVSWNVAASVMVTVGGRVSPGYAMLAVDVESDDFLSFRISLAGGIS